MHTKEELTRKKAQSSEQLDLVEVISTENKVRQKRLFLFIAIFATVGLSLIFWVYRAVRSISFSLPNVSSAPLHRVVAPSLSTQISDILGKDASKWKIDTSQDSGITANISQLKTSKNSLVKDSLPQGIDVMESVVAGTTSQSFSILITVPQKRIYISVKSEDSDLNKFKSIVSKLIPAIYWSIIESTSN